MLFLRKICFALRKSWYEHRLENIPTPVGYPMELWWGVLRWQCNAGLEERMFSMPLFHTSFAQHDDGAKP